MKHLPNKPSKLLTVAMKDLEKAEKMSNVTIDMDKWFFKRENRCRACLAGVTILGSGEATLHKRHNITPDCFNVKTEYKLYAINHFRRGKVIEGLRCLSIKKPRKLRYLYAIPDYETDPLLFKSKMWSLIERLESVGL